MSETRFAELYFLIMKWQSRLPNGESAIKPGL